MANMGNTEVVARRVLPIIYVVDTSGSMYGERIAKVNQAMLEMPRVLKDVSNDNPDAETRVGVLQFSTGAKWVTPGLVQMEDFYWNKLEAGGTTMFAEMLNELHAKLSRSEYMKSDAGFCVPVVIFMSDGEPTDVNGVWEQKLEWVKQNNKWFQHATKIAIAIDEEADKEALAKLVGTREAVIQVNDVNTLKTLIQVVSMTASKIGSTSRTSHDVNPAQEIIKETVKQIDPQNIKMDDGKGNFVNPIQKPDADPVLINPAAPTPDPVPGSWPTEVVW